jgi:threonylcarbamoyladenosine tRNA methylthiotransferase MtaB
VRVYLHTFGCKANQYDTERMRLQLEAGGALTVESSADADVCVVNTCTVTNHADADARRYVRRLKRESPQMRIVVAGCSAALRADEYRSMHEVAAVVEGHDATLVARAAGQERLVTLGSRRSLLTDDQEPIGALLSKRPGATRGWLKVQDGCDRKCGFCATRLARGESRSRHPEEVAAEARSLAAMHPELVITGIHIGHYGRDLVPETSLARLVAKLLDEVPSVRFRLGSVEATEIDDELFELLVTSAGRLAPHVHMPLQSGSDPVLARMRRWHTRDAYRRRALELAERLPVLGMGADVITGFPGETDQEHADTVALVEELPFTYLHVFPFSPRDGTAAAELHRRQPVPQRVAAERGKELRLLAQAKSAEYQRRRVGTSATVTIEDGGRSALTEDYLRVEVRSGTPPAGGLRIVRLEATDGHLYIDLPREQREGVAVGERPGLRTTENLNEVS